MHFLNLVAVNGSLRTAGGPPVTITGGEVVPSIPVLPIDEATAWSADSSGRPVLALSVAAPGDMSTYRLTVFSAKLDPFFDQAPLRFHTDSGPGSDGASALPSPPAPVGEPVPIDYLAKDFASFRQALSDFSTLRYPAWVERSEADLGVVLMEALAAIADELAITRTASRRSRPSKRRRSGSRWCVTPGWSITSRQRRPSRQPCSSSRSIRPRPVRAG